MPIEKDPDASQPRARPQRVSDATQTPQLSATVSRRHFVIGAGGIAAARGSARRDVRRRAQGLPRHPQAHGLVFQGIYRRK